MEFIHTGDGLPPEVVDGGRSLVVVESENVVAIGTGANGVSVLVKFCGGPRLVTIGAGRPDDTVDSTPGWVTAVASGAMTVAPDDIELALGSEFSLVKILVAPYARGVEETSVGCESGNPVPSE